MLVANVQLEVEVDSYDPEAIKEIIDEQIMRAWLRDREPSIKRWSVKKIDIPV